MPPITWLELSLVVDGELAEAIAEVLSRYLPDGVAIMATAIAPELDGEGIPVGPVRVCGYLPMDEQLEETRQQIEEALWYLGRIRPVPAPQYQPITEINWVDAWKQHYHPISIGRRLIVVPAWMESPEPDRVPIRMDPGMAFGTGTHPTTQLCLEALDERVKPGQEVIDVGCGSGILSIAALKLGARQALAVDVDPEAVANTHVNATANGVTDRLEVGLGSVAEIRSGAFSIQKAPLVLANILAPVLVRLLEAGLANLVTPEGVLVLSGILEGQWDETKASSPLQEALRAQGLRVIREMKSGDWVAVCVSF